MTPTSLRVLHVIDSAGLYGAEAMLLDLCSELRALDQVPIIASVGHPREPEKPLERAARARRLEVRPVRIGRGPNPLGAIELVRHARIEKADVIHTHGYKGNILLGFLPRRVRRVPIIATVHGYTDVGAFDRLALYRLLDGLALAHVDRAVLVHRGMVATGGLARLRDGRWSVIENGIRLASPDVDVPADITEICAGRFPVIGAIGRLSAEKGFESLLRAARDVLLQHDRAILLIFGEGPERAALERLSSQLGIADRVAMPGYRAEARNCFRLFDVFVLPSLTEGLPITLLEAMQAGVPIVASAVGGVPDALANGDAGMLIRAGDTAGLERAIRQCVDDPAWAARLRVRAHSNSTRFTSHSMARQYLDLYREVTREGSSTPAD
jgi:glycosyltransferase involved in cell wall biosynthesis